MSLKRILFPNKGEPKSPLKAAIFAAHKLAKECGINSISLITTVKKFSGVAGEVLGPDVVRSLEKGTSIQLIPGVSLSHQSVKTIARAQKPQIAVALYIDNEGMIEIEDLAIPNLIYVPFTEKEGADWAHKWDADVNGVEAVSTPLNLSAEVTGALKRLTDYVNLSTGLGHPSDRNLAHETVAALRAKGETWDSSEIEKWSLKNGWRPSHAAELANLFSSYS